MATFIWPTDTKRVTSGFRTQSRSTHDGLDIADSGTRPIFAVAAGTVSRSYYSSSYGECIMIVHNIRGQIWETVYAHLRSGSRRVKDGDSVQQGQTIGTMGNTGNSTGQHLHFELHKGRWNSNKSNAVDPLDYLERNSSSSTTTNNLIRRGDSGEIVQQLQQNLLKVGEELPRFGADGHFNAETEQAVKAFQARHHLKEDGLAGPETLGKIEEVLKNRKRTVHLPASARRWRLYDEKTAPIAGNEIAYVYPSRFDGLTYEIVEDGPEPHTYIIKTKPFGNVKIFAGPSTNAEIKEE